MSAADQTTHESCQDYGFNPPSRILTTLALCAALFMPILDSAVANMELSTLAGYFGFGRAESTWIVTLFMVGAAMTLPLTGFVAKRVGEVRLLVACLMMFTVITFFSSMATSSKELLIYRILQGLVTGPIYPLAQTLLITIYPRCKIPTALGILGVMTALAPLSGPIFGGMLRDDLNWHIVFLFSVPFGIFASVVLYVQMLGRPEKTAPVKLSASNYLGLSFLLFGAACLQIMLDFANHENWWDSPSIVILAVLAAIGLTAFLAWELTDDRPFFDFSLFRHSHFLWATIILVLTFSVYLRFSLINPIWMVRSVSYDGYWAALSVTPFGMIALLMLPVFSRIVNKVDYRIWVTIACSIFMFDAFWQSHLLVDITSGWHIVISQISLGIAAGLLFMPLFAIFLARVPPHKLLNAFIIFGILRHMSDSTITAITAYFLKYRGIVHRAEMSELISNKSNVVQSAVQGFGGDPSPLSGLVARQASMLEFSDFFFVIGGVFFVIIILVWTTKKVDMNRIDYHNR